MPTISCPLCGASRTTPAKRLPQRPCLASCPACQGRFRFDPAALDLPDRKAQEQVRCPHCGLSRNLPTNRSLPQNSLLSCRRCQTSFAVGEAPHSDNLASPSTAPPLVSVGQLFAASWERFICQDGWKLLLILLAGSLLLLIPVLLAALFLPATLIGRPLAAWGWLLMVLGCAFGIGVLQLGVLLMQLRYPELKLFSVLRLGGLTFLRLSVLCLLWVILVAGSSLLLVLPGAIFAVWFCLAPLILVDQNCSPLDALKKSRQLIRPFFRAIASRLLLLLSGLGTLVFLVKRLPLAGPSVLLLAVILATPFLLIFLQQIYHNLKDQQKRLRGSGVRSRLWPCFSLALLGLLLIPGLWLTIQPQANPLLSSRWIDTPLLNPLTGHPATVAELTADLSDRPALSAPQDLTREDYDLLLGRALNATGFGPATLSTRGFWREADRSHLWLEVQFAKLPNLDLSLRRTARVMIDHVFDRQKRDRYDAKNSFEAPPFSWLELRPSAKPGSGLHGIRDITLDRGTQSDQVERILGRLELSLPLNIQSLQLSPQDVGKTFPIAGERLMVDRFDKDRLEVSFTGSAQRVLSIRGYDHLQQPLSSAGEAWQSKGKNVSLLQIFSGAADGATLLIACDTLTRSYPFEITP